MQKLSERHRRYLLVRSICEMRKRRDRSASIVSEKRAESLRQFQFVRNLLPPPKIDFETRPGHVVLHPPVKLCLATNYEESLAFFLDMRQLPELVKNSGHALKLFIEISELRAIEPSAGLVLAAEIDRWQVVTKSRLRSFDGGWHPPVRKFLQQAGLFDLLRIEPEDADVTSTSANGDIVFEVLPFVRGYSVSGMLGSTLRDRLEALCGKSVGPRHTVYEAISEAIANTRHAYPQGHSIWPVRLAGRWWASGSWRPDTQTVSLHLYDQGVGIPATLPRSPHWSDIIRAPILVQMAEGLKGLVNPEYGDDRLIEAALVVGRTSTGQKGRGKGLAEMVAWIERLGSGRLRVSSGRGSVTYLPGGVIERDLRRVPFVGTLIEWEIDIHD